MQRANPICKVELIENNVLAYQKPTKMSANMIKEKGIKKVNWLANSPDLYLIENI